MTADQVRAAASGLRTRLGFTGDLVAVSDLDVRYNMGYRRGWLTVGVVVHGASPLPGHGAPASRRSSPARPVFCGYALMGPLTRA